MRKTAVAIAIACAIPALACAQSAQNLQQVVGQGSVVLYGILDVGVELLDAGNDSLTRVQGSGMWSGNRFGIRGSETLGGGYSAIFTLEGRFSLTTGSVTYNESVYWCRLTGSTAAPVCPGVTVVPGTAISLLPVNSVPYQTVLGGLNAINNTLLQAITTVNSAAALFDRQAFAGLVTPYGAVLFGRQYTPGYEILFKYNVMNDASALSFGQGYNNLAIRMNNAIVYRAELKGFTLNAMYSFGGAEAGSTADSRNERVTPPTTGDDFYGINLQYNTTNWGVGAGWNQNYVVPYATQAAGTPEKKTGLQTFNLGAFVGFGPFKVYGEYMQRKNENPILTPLDIQNLLVSGGAAAFATAIASVKFNSYDMDTMRGVVGPTDSKAYHLGASWQFMPKNTLYAVYNYAIDDGRSTWATADAVVNHYGLAYQYQFSPRTSLYATVALMQNRDQARITPSSAGYTSGFATSAGADAAAYQLGMRHLF